MKNEQTPRLSMKHVLATLVIALLVTKALGQQLIQWQKSFGGSFYDEAYAVIQTSDGGFVTTGFAISNDGDVIGHNLGLDYWVIKQTNNGDMQWQKCLGGSNNDWPHSIKETIDGGYIIAGSSLSNDGDVSQNKGNNDYWVVKIDAVGEVEWEKSFGGSQDDEAFTVIQSSDSGFVIAGYTASVDGNITGNHGGYDCWVIKLSNNGDLVWQKTFGGSGLDQAFSIKQTIGGGFIMVGESNSNDGDISVNNGNIDYWVVKMSATGDLEWEKTLGGAHLDVGTDVIQNENGDFIIFGYEGAYNSGNVTGSHGGFDYWVVKLSQSGSILWQKTYGGSNNDWGRAISSTTDGGYILAGTTDSNDGDALDNDGGQDAFTIKIDSTGEIIWKKTFGGAKAEDIISIQQTTDHGFILAGYSWSSNGDVSQNHGYNDFWIVKLAPEATPTNEPANQAAQLEIFPNPATNTITFKTPDNEPILHIMITDMSGREIMQQSNLSANSMHIATLERGSYLVTATTTSGKLCTGVLQKM